MPVSVLAAPSVAFEPRQASLNALGAFVWMAGCGWRVGASGVWSDGVVVVGGQAASAGGARPRAAL